jgi:magnesium transporter
MITIHKNVENGLVTLNEPTSGCWINVINPTPEEIIHLEKLGVAHDYTIYALDLDERPRTERENGDLLIVLRIPFYQGQNVDIPYTTLPLGIIFTPDYLVTVCKWENDILNEFLSGRMRDLSTSKRQRFALAAFYCK